MMGENVNRGGGKKNRAAENGPLTRAEWLRSFARTTMTLVSCATNYRRLPCPVEISCSTPPENRAGERQSSKCQGVAGGGVGTTATATTVAGEVPTGCFPTGEEWCSEEMQAEREIS
uniref:Uncharacterized protein n=1 Tax=Opuntia streptacantha TaxID=393608 RepID=A0A7C9DWR7_OPUST